MNMEPHIVINGRQIGRHEPVYIVAELSANHNQIFEQAVSLIHAAKDAGVDAVKLQTYTPDTITIDCDNEYFRIQGTLWEGQRLYDLYGKAFTPWDWQPKLKALANGMGLDLFSAPFDETAVDFLEDMNVPAYKIASFEIVDLPLIRKVAQTSKPVILSTGMATQSEIGEAVEILRQHRSPMVLLKCTSAYPAMPEEMNLCTIPDLAKTFRVPVGLSDHTMDIAVPVAAVALGACVVEKHLTLSRAVPGPDCAFSLEPKEFEGMVAAVRVAEKSLGKIHYGVSEHEPDSRNLRRSLFVVRDMKSGEKFTSSTVRSIRPGHGLSTRHMEEILGRTASRDIKCGTPLTWDLVVGNRR